MTLGSGRAGTSVRAMPLGIAPVVVAAALMLAALSGCGQPADAVTAPDPVLAMLDVAWAQPGSDVDRMEQLVAECMADEGFAYLPSSSVTPDASSPADPAAGTAAGTAAGAGYGITSGPHPAPPAADANAAAVAALTPQERQAYWTALEGTAGGTDGTDGTDDTATSSDGSDGADWQYDWQQAGCRGRAQNAVYGDPATLDDAAALEAELGEARLAAASDPRVADLDATWAGCMQASGHADLASPDDAEAGIRGAWEALWASVWADVPADATAPDIAAAEAGAQPAVDDLARQEAAIAAADRACREQTDYDAARDAVTAEYRQRFYQAHRTALEEWFGASGGSDG